MKRFLEECRRRRVFRVAALYIVGAWVALQVADLAFESWGIPKTALRHIWTGALLGFPVALIFGWRYEVVGGHIARTADGGEPGDLALSRADYFILVALAGVLMATVLGIGVEITAQGPSDRTEASVAGSDQRSIAVLPFANMSPDADNGEFLANGIQDELLTRLSKISDLKVISRTSTERYRGTSMSVPAIAGELGVGRILEGGVQRAGDQIRVNVQLIDGVSDEHVWAETYDRRMSASGIFAIQTEIVEAIVAELKATLTPGESRQLAAMPTGNFDAYTAYLKGRQAADAESVASMNEAIEDFRLAIELDPDFALAHVGLADAYLTLGANFLGGLPVNESNALAEPPLMRALELDPDLGEAYAALGLLRQQQGDPVAAQRAYERAMSLRPNYSRVLLLYGRMRWQEGKRDAAVALFQKALDLDPYSAPANFQYARSLDQSGRFEEALERYLRTVEIEPDHAFAYVYIAAIHFLVRGRIDESLIWYRKAAENDALSPSLQAAQAIGYLELGDTESARSWLERGLALGPETFWPAWAAVLMNVKTGDKVAAHQYAKTLFEAYPQFWGALNVLRNADLEAGRYEAARSRYARSYRELAGPGAPEVSTANYFAAVDLSLVLQRLGEHERADQLLAGCLEVLESVPRLGTNGYWITDARVYALQRRPQRALAALRQAFDEGWRTFAWYYLDHDPTFELLREDPDFQQLREEIRNDLAAQARRVADLQASGDL